MITHFRISRSLYIVSWGRAKKGYERVNILAGMRGGASKEASLAQDVI